MVVARKSRPKSFGFSTIPHVEFTPLVLKLSITLTFFFCCNPKPVRQRKVIRLVAIIPPYPVAFNFKLRFVPCSPHHFFVLRSWSTSKDRTIQTTGHAQQSCDRYAWLFRKFLKAAWIPKPSSPLWNQHKYLQPNASQDMRCPRSISPKSSNRFPFKKLQNNVEPGFDAVHVLRQTTELPSKSIFLATLPCLQESSKPRPPCFCFQ